MPRGITLTRYTSPNVTLLNRGDGVRLRITASDGLSMANEVFLLKRRILDAQTGAITNEFCAVASPEDLIAYPIDAPHITASPAYFLSDTVDVVVGSVTTADQIWQEVKTRVCKLVEALNRKDELSTEDVVDCGTPDVTESESMSVSN